MKFTRVRINNFYNLKDVDLDLTSQGQALIVGPNGSGKSNIIKCIEFLVNRILGKDPPSGDIWDVDAVEAYIEVSAVLSKKEVEFFLNLRVFYRLCDVCEMIHFLCNIYTRLASKYVPWRSGESAEKLANTLKERERVIFGGLPTKTLTLLIGENFFRKGNKEGEFVFDETSYDENEGCLHPCIKALILKTINNIFPHLLKITREAMASEQSRPADQLSDLLLSVFKAKTGIQGLDSSDSM